MLRWLRVSMRWAVYDVVRQLHIHLPCFPLTVPLSTMYLLIGKVKLIFTFTSDGEGFVVWIPHGVVKWEERAFGVLHAGISITGACCSFFGRPALQEPCVSSQLEGSCCEIFEGRFDGFCLQHC